MKSFEYIRPNSMGEAFQALGAYDNPFVLAGGTDLLVWMKRDVHVPECVVDLKGIPDLNSIRYEDGFRFGALTTVREVETSLLVREKIPTLCEAAGSLGSVQIRNRATIGGNLCNASPAADMAAILLALDAEVTVASPKGEKMVPLNEFFAGPQQTVLAKEEVLSEITIPTATEACKGVYLKHGPRKAMDIGTVNIAILLDADSESHCCNQIRISLGAVAPTPMRAGEAEALAQGKTLTPEVIREVAETAAGEANPISDFRASADYRRELIKGLVAKGISKILENGRT